jgi:hypothetical protein
VKYTEKELNGGVQRLYRFENGYGASVIRHNISYGRDEGLWELAVIRYRYPDSGSYVLVYDTPIADDVIGHLTEPEVEKLLMDIEALPKHG